MRVNLPVGFQAGFVVYTSGDRVACQAQTASVPITPHPGFCKGFPFLQECLNRLIMGGQNPGIVG